MFLRISQISSKVPCDYLSKCVLIRESSVDTSEWRPIVTLPADIYVSCTQRSQRLEHREHREENQAYGVWSPVGSADSGAAGPRSSAIRIPARTKAAPNRARGARRSPR